ncbi:DUF7344 domain-containing protein [Natrarchaeobius oligotrophus]|nr:hypothetical protein [Natrarchaeobius chitinivorans]
MKPETRNPNDGGDGTPAITPTELFRAFSSDRRQRALDYLAAKPAAIPLGDVAEFVALEEGEPSYDRYERILVDLYHNHLPQLTDVGLVAYDAETELVSLAIDRAVVAPYLRLADSSESVAGPDR